MVHAGVDVTIIAHSEWLLDWKLVPVNRVISGIGRAATSLRNKRTILIKGPEGGVAMVGLFIVSAPVTFWGRDL